MREKAGSWRHAGFIPKVTDYDTSLEGLQTYHDCLSVILKDLQQLQENPPTVELNLGGYKKQVRLILEVAFMMGDQKSQDRICGRKNSNNGGAGRIHRGCMCSVLHASNSTRKCVPICKSVVDRLTGISFEDRADSPAMIAFDTLLPLNVRGNQGKRKKARTFIERRARLARDILGRTYTMHDIHNAFDHIGFGSNDNKILSATLDDPLHFCNSGLFQYMGQVGYLGMQDKEREELESLALSQVQGVRSSARHNYPRARYSKGFTNMTLLTADEKVGINFSMLLTLHNDQARYLMEKTFKRQQTKYQTFNIPRATKTKLRSKLSSTTHENNSANEEDTDDCSVSPIHADDILQFPLRNHFYFAREKGDKFWPRTPESC